LTSLQAFESLLGCFFLMKNVVKFESVRILLSIISR